MSFEPSERGNATPSLDQTSAPRESPRLNRRDLLKLTLCGGAGLSLEGLLDPSEVKAATRDLKLSNVTEFTTSCNFCSCGCGMIAAVDKAGKLISMEGDYDHIVSRGSLCVKGISMFATHASPKRLTKPLYRAPGSDHWEELEWKDAAERVARKIKKVRDENWIATEKLVDKTHVANKDAFGREAGAPAPEAMGSDVPVNRTDAIAFLGGAQNTNEECYIFQKASRLLGIPWVEHQARL
jgi:formate dehydrogenase major subunit